MPRRLIALSLLALALTACGPRYVREEFYDQDGITIELRSETREGQTVTRGFDHPATISAIRCAHILAAIDVRMGEEEGKSERVAAFPTATLYQVGEQLSRAFAKVAPDQEVVVRAVRKETRLGIFNAKFLTSFTAWMKGDDLILHLSRVEWEIPKTDEEQKIPEPFADKVVQEFKVLPSEGIVPTGNQEVAVDWKNPAFREPKRIRVGAGGKILRQTVLMDSEAPKEEEKEPAVLPSDLSPETLRALADLQEQRQHGEISETTYHQKRRDLLRQVEDDEKGQQIAPKPEGQQP